MAGCTERKGLVQILARKIKVKRRLIAENIMLGVAENSLIQSVKSMTARCGMTIPFGAPVEPEVNSR